MSYRQIETGAHVLSEPPNGEHKYARVECERRFLVDRLPAGLGVTRTRQVTDRYIDGTFLRLRKLTEDNGPTVLKLTQKLPSSLNGARRTLITTIYLTNPEFEVLAQLPATMLSKARYSVPPFGIDVFEGALRGLVLAEIEMPSSCGASDLVLPSFIRCEVTSDDRFTGGSLVRASRENVASWLAEYGIAPQNA